MTETNELSTGSDNLAQTRRLATSVCYSLPLYRIAVTLDTFSHCSVCSFPAVLTFRSYQQNQGGKYECRVTGPGNNSETLPVRIGGCHV